jgi:hypothetical protein
MQLLRLPASCVANIGSFLDDLERREKLSDPVLSKIAFDQIRAVSVTPANVDRLFRDAQVIPNIPEYSWALEGIIKDFFYRSGDHLKTHQLIKKIYMDGKSLSLLKEMTMFWLAFGDSIEKAIDIARSIPLGYGHFDGYSYRSYDWIRKEALQSCCDKLFELGRMEEAEMISSEI